MTEKARSSRSSSSEQKLLVGRVGRAVGLRGEVEVLVVSDDPHRFEPGSVLNETLTVRSVRQQGDRTIVAFAEITDRNGAEALKGAELCVPPAQARTLEDGEFWDHDLVGCEVVTTAGERVGVVADVLHQPANEVLVVDTDGAQALIPMVRSVVTSVEPRVRITIDPLPGLLD